MPRVAQSASCEIGGLKAEGSKRFGENLYSTGFANTIACRAHFGTVLSKFRTVPTLPREHRNDPQVLVLKTLVEQTFYSRCYAPAGESANCSAFSKRITSSRAKLRRDWACNRH